MHPRPPHTHTRVGDGDHTPPPGMSQEQLEYFAEEARRAAAKGAKEGSRKTARNGLIGFLILFAGISYNSYDSRHTAASQNSAIVNSGRIVSVDGCNRDFKDDVRFINLLQRLKDANDAAYNNLPPALRDAAQHKVAQAFYEGEIKRGQQALPDCRVAKRVVTADPNAPRPDIVPLYVHKGAK